MQKLATDYPTGVFRYRFQLKEGGLSAWHYYEFYPSHGFGEGEVEFLCGAQLDASRAETDAANARAEALELQVASWKRAFDQMQADNDKHGELAERFLVERDDLKAKLAKAVEFVKGRQHDDDAWGHGAAAEDETILAEIEEGKSP